MQVTVAVCTWNRSNLLDQTLTQMESLRIPAGVEWELLVVNNNSTDDTDTVLARHAATGKLPLRSLFEVKPGQSNARNCALAEAKGELLLWTDDDVQIGQEWIEEYVRAAEKYPNAVYFGGPIRPWFPIAPPTWMEKQFRPVGWLWALIEGEAVEHVLAHGQQVYGANMAYRTEVLRRYPFDAKLGHIGAVPSGGDELAIQAALQRDGYKGVWLAGNAVQHYVMPERMTLKYVRTRAFFDGKAQYRPGEIPSNRVVGGVPGWLIRTYAAATLRSWAGRLTRTSSWLTWYVRAAWYRGAISAARAVHLNAKATL